AMQKAMFDKQVELQAPFREAGLSANNRLAYLLGLSPDGFGGGGSGSGSSSRSFGVADLVDESGGDWRPNAELYAADPGYKQAWDSFMAAHQSQYGVTPNVGRGSDLGYVESELAKGGYGAFDLTRYNQSAAERAAASKTNAQNDPAFGSLMRRFSMADFEADPGYAFRMKEGLAGVEAGAAARGGLLSGAAQKALQKYGQGLASQEYGNAYGRFTADQTNQYNRLAGLVNTGQGATNQTANAAANFGQQAGANAIGAGNALASGQIGGANALVGGINGAYNNIQNNKLMDLIRNPGAGRPSGPSNSEIWSQINGFS
ncbi:MAG: hypothetical protein V3W06_10460, partial [Acidimicrobiia bacterium]